MLILSHRGYHVRAPENTLEAFERMFTFEKEIAY
jgi:glycerophosphoryl diester phosphodiesterase